jgi:hypothetical protein
VYFEAGPSAFFRPYHQKEMVVGPLGLSGNDFGNDSWIRGPRRGDRSNCGGAGTAIGPEEIEVERVRLPDRLYVPGVAQTVETVRSSVPGGGGCIVLRAGISQEASRRPRK